MSPQTRRALHIHVGQASHFLRWELPIWASHFHLVPAPDPSALLLSFGPDALFEAARMPASGRFANLFPGFGANPLHNRELRARHLQVLDESFAGVFINPGPLQLAYNDLPHVILYPFSVDTASIPFSVRHRIESLLHASADYPQKDIERNQAVMQATGLSFEVFPPRRASRWNRGGLPYRLEGAALRTASHAGALLHLKQTSPQHAGYEPHQLLYDKYLSHDAFVHVAADIRHPLYIDGKYTATLMEAAISGALVFWHDTFALGNDLETVFTLPEEPKAAAAEILKVRGTVDVESHSRSTRAEFLDRFDPHRSVAIRAAHMLS